MNKKLRLISGGVLGFLMLSASIFAATDVPFDSYTLTSRGVSTCTSNTSGNCSGIHISLDHYAKYNKQSKVLTFSESSADKHVMPIQLENNRGSSNFCYEIDSVMKLKSKPLSFCEDGFNTYLYAQFHVVRSSLNITSSLSLRSTTIIHYGTAGHQIEVSFKRRGVAYAQVQSR